MARNAKIGLMIVFLAGALYVSTVQPQIAAD